MKKITLILLGLMMSMIFVYANSMAPTSIPGKAGIRVDKDTGIKLIDEDIIINISDDFDKTQYTVNYRFTNISEKKIETPIWFLTRGYLNAHDFKVSIDNKEMSSETITLNADEIVNWDVEKISGFIDPFTERSFDSTIDRYSGDHLSVDEFLLEMERGQVSDVLIEYKVWNGYISPRITDYINDIKLSSYMLSPAAFYEGDSKVDIVINTPVNTIIKSNLKLEKTNNKTYEIKDYYIKENENLQLSFSKKPGITELFTHEKKGFCIRLFILQVMLLVSIKVIHDRAKKRILKWILILSFAAYMRIAGYGSMFIFAMLIRILWIPVLIGFAIIWNKKYKNEEVD